MSLSGTIPVMFKGKNPSWGRQYNSVSYRSSSESYHLVSTCLWFSGWLQTRATTSQCAYGWMRATPRQPLSAMWSPPRTWWWSGGNTWMATGRWCYPFCRNGARLERSRQQASRPIWSRSGRWLTNRHTEQHNMKSTSALSHVADALIQSHSQVRLRAIRANVRQRHVVVLYNLF